MLRFRNAYQGGEGNVDTSKTTLEDAFRVLGETPGKPVPKTISEPEIPEMDDRKPAGQIAEPIQPEPSKTDQTGISAAGPP